MKTAGCLAQTRLNYALVLGGLAALGPLCTDLYISALPQITHIFQSDPSATQLTLTSSLVGLGIGQLFFGPLSDRYGRLIPLFVSLILLCLSSLICCYVSNIEQLIMARFLQGIAGSGGVVIARAIARDQYSGHELTHFFALLMMVNGVAPILAPVAGASLLAIIDWRGIFAVLTAISVFLLLFCHLQLHETLPRQNRADSSLFHTFIQMLSLLKYRRFIGLCLTQGFVIAGMFAYIAASSFVLQNYYGLSAQLYSLCFATNGLGLVIAAQLAARLAKRIGEQRLLRYILLFALLMVGCLIVAGGFQVGLWVYLPLLFATIVVNSMVGATCTSLSMSAVPAQIGGGASALLGALMFSLGGISAPLSSLGGATPMVMALSIGCCYFLACVVFLTFVGWQLPPHSER